MARAIVSVVASLALIYALIAAALFFFQSRLVFLPQIGRDYAPTPAEYGLEFEDLRIAAADGTRLHAWFVPAREPRATVLFLHGNAGTIAHRVAWLPMFQQIRADALLLEYRGYGESTGTPSEAGLYADAQAAWDYLTATRGTEAARIVVFGESLGGAPAAWLAARVPAGALVLHSAFSSAPDLAAELYRWLPARRLTRFEFDARAQLASVTCPVLVAHSPQDEVIPFSHGQRLYAAAQEPKQFLRLAGGHNEGFLFTRAEWVAQLEAFLDRHLPPQLAG